MQVRDEVARGYADKGHTQVGSKWRATFEEPRLPSSPMPSHRKNRHLPSPPAPPHTDTDT